MSALHMMRIPLDAVKVMALAQRRGFPMRELDLGYVIHCALDELFGPELSPKPFSFPLPTKGEGNGKVIPVLAYGDHDTEALRAHASAFAEPGVHALCRWDELADKRLPERFEAGRRLGFTVRACPIVRVAKAGVHQDKAGAEVDAFLVACRRVARDVPVSREAVYADWLRAEFARRGGAMLDDVKMTRFERERLFRRRAPTQDGARRTHLTERPDAVLEGTLTVTDPVAFDALLRRGVGRHRAFGFGMLLLRPPGR